MKLLEERILKDGIVLPGDVLKVGSFVNQLTDINLLAEMAKEVKRLFCDCPVTKILTVEASGIAFATAVALEFGVNSVFAKKSVTSNVTGELYKAKIHSYTHNNDYTATVPVDYIDENDILLIVDDFLASGEAFLGLIDIAKQAGARVAGVCAIIEKGFQKGGEIIAKQGVRVEALAIVDKMGDGVLEFRPQ